MTFDPNNALCFGQEFFPPNLVAIEHFLAIWPLVDPRWLLHDLWPQQCTALWSGVLLTKFGSHRAFLRQIDPWMTLNPRWGRFENMPTNLVDPSPTPMPSFSSIPQTHSRTYIYTYRLYYFCSVDMSLLSRHNQGEMTCLGPQIIIPWPVSFSSLFCLHSWKSVSSSQHKLVTLNDLYGDICVKISVTDRNFTWSLAQVTVS